MTTRPLDEIEEADFRRRLADASGAAFLPRGWRFIVAYLPGLLATLDAERARATWNVDSDGYVREPLTNRGAS